MHAHLSFFPNLVGASIRADRLPDLTIFLWHIASIFLLLLATWQLSSACFKNTRPRWGAVLTVAALLSVPVAGTALVIMDPYLTARSLSTPATIFAIAAYVSGRRARALAWFLFTGLIHPQMCVYLAAFLPCLELPRYLDRNRLAVLSALPFVYGFGPATGPAREALFSRAYFFVSTWAWYEWLGVFAPLVILWWLAHRLPYATPDFRRLARALVPFGLLFTVAAVTIAACAPLENYARLQPMRAFHLVYILFFVLLGGLMAETVLKARAWRWIAVFLPLAASMWLVQQSAFPHSPHVEWPGRRDPNAWISAFDWIRDNTPKSAVFAVDPSYMLLPGEDMHGFRAIAERSVLADSVKDNGAVSLFPQLAGEWESEVQAASGWRHFTLADFELLASRYPVTWVLTANPAAAGLICLYRNSDLAVCRIPLPQTAQIRVTSQ